MLDNGKITPIIMSGGAGSRLWPLSRQAEPKQMLALMTDKTMLQETVARFDLDLYNAPVFICNADHADMISEQMSQMGVEIGSIIIEPEGRNTAPCAVVAALHAMEVKDGNGLFLLVPADHHISRPDAFRRAVAAGAPIASRGYLVTFGVEPDYPATGFGYIRKGDSLSPGTFNVDEFVEKPPLDVAQTYLKADNYFWNSGIFLFDAKTLLSEMQNYSPEVETHARASYENARIKNERIYLDATDFANVPSAPVDKAVMEYTQKAAVIPCKLGWHDIGGFKALHDLKAGEDGMAISGNVIAKQTTNSLLDTDGPLVSVVGMDNVAVIVKEGRVLVLNLDMEQDVKTIVETLKSTGQTEFL
ncbi:MAG: sugar phosphate nucleotidyltransferase [Litorimonas sp.]